MHTTSLIIHVTAAAVLFGPQVLMFFAVTPATWMVQNEALKRDLVRVVAGRFGLLATVAIVVLVVTGLYQYYSIPVEIRDDPEGYRFGMLFAIKMGAFTLTLILIGLHVGVFTRRITRLSDAVLGGDEDQRGALEMARTQSFLFSLAVLAATLVTLGLGVALGDHTFSFAQR